MPLLLRSEDVAPLLDIKGAIKVVEAVFVEQSRGAVAHHGAFHLNVTGGAMRVTSGALHDTGIMGVRTGTSLGLTAPSGVNNHACVLYGTDGELRGIMGYPFGTLRTSAVMASSIDRMARPDAETLGLVGSGRTASALLEGVMAVRNIKKISVYSRDAERRKRFCDRASEKLGIPVRPADEMRQVVSGQDIVMTASNQRKPLFPAEWLDPGTHLSSMGPIAELDEKVLLLAKPLVVASKALEEEYYLQTPPFPLLDLIRAGRLTWDDVAELGEVIDGRVSVRRSRDDITVFHESQGGITDIALATSAFNEAVRRGLGQEISL
ncbi:MAG TPA: hypothetical protein VGO34_06580 [Alphaproteobacteria bacterium]|jgi:ornithine cyclodeaminase/alanine dehydrogenase-like protein (mu-crystallin family)